MIAKVIAHAPSREAALDRLADALDRTVVAGPRSNLALLAALCRTPEFRAGRFDTGFIDRWLPKLRVEGMDRAAAARGVLALIEAERARIARSLGREPGEPPSPWDATDGFQLSGRRTTALSVLVDGQPARAEVVSGSGGTSVAVDGTAPDLDAAAFEAADGVYVLRRGRQTVVRRADLGAGDADHGGGDGLIAAPMHGKLLALHVAVGDKVTKGQRLAVIEAMKMEHALIAPVDGRVAEIAVKIASQVAEGVKVMMIEPMAKE
jgi:3-methylcrotonyl-CoA carboxylase alpha subunit